MKKVFLPLLLLIINYSHTTGQSVNWAEDISCIFYTHCTNCHNPNGSAPFSLINYNNAYNFRHTIKTSVESKMMPPWPPDEDYQRFKHERVLSSSEIDLIKQWVDGGAPEGNPALTPTPPVYTTSYEITNPEVDVKMPVYTVPNLNYDLYRCFVLPTNQTIDQYITGIEVTPGNRNIVHHVLVYYDTSDYILTLDSLDPGAGYTSYGGTGSPTSNLITGWVPGSTADFFPAGMGMKLPYNARIIIQIHYPLGSTGKQDSTEVRLKLTTVQQRDLLNVAALEYFTTLTNGPLYIPANTIKTFHEKYTIPVNVSIIGISPHAHLICESMKAFAVKPNQDTVPLIDIPNWDFHWQGNYYFKKPVILPLGTDLHGYATYNNTINNPNNPSNPPQNVSAGEATTDEMMLYFFLVAIYQPGDENLVFDNTSHTLHYLGCETINDIPEETLEQDIVLFPNPVESGSIQITNLPAKGTYKMYALNGQMVKQGFINEGSDEINLQDLSKGSYTLQISFHNALIHKKFIKF